MTSARGEDDDVRNCPAILQLSRQGPQLSFSLSDLRTTCLAFSSRSQGQGLSSGQPRVKADRAGKSVTSALEVHGRHGRLHVVVGHVVVRIVVMVVVTDAGRGVDGLRGHGHVLTHGLRGAEGQQVMDGVGGGPGAHHAGGASTRVLALQTGHAWDTGTHGCLVLRVRRMVMRVAQ